MLIQVFISCERRQPQAWVPINLKLISVNIFCRFKLNTVISAIRLSAQVVTVIMSVYIFYNNFNVTVFVNLHVAMTLDNCNGFVKTNIVKLPSCISSLLTTFAYSDCNRAVSASRERFISASMFPLQPVAKSATTNTINE